MAAAAKSLLLAVAGTLAVLATAFAHDRITTPISWDREVSPIIQARCTACHRASGRAPMPLGTYAQARPWARAIKEQVLLRRMPKWHAVRGFGDIANDPSLSPFEIAVIAAWVDGGAPEKPTRTSASAVTLPAPSMSTVRIAPETTRVVTTDCGTRALPPGRLLAVRPALARGTDAGVAVDLGGDQRAIIVWVKNYEPDFRETYWLRAPLELTGESRLLVETASPLCAIELTLAR